MDEFATAHAADSVFDSILLLILGKGSGENIRCFGVRLSAIRSH
jgi:hypothetical protein